MNLISSSDIFVFVIINGSKHVQTITSVKSWSRFYKVVQLHKPR